MDAHPERSRRGRPRVPDEAVFHRLVLFLRAGCSWQSFDELIRGSGISGRTCRRRWASWRDARVFERVCETLRSELPECDVGHLDATFIRARGGGDMVGLTRHGKGSKIQAMCNDQSRPIAFQLASANPHERRITPGTLDHAGTHLPQTIVADQAYDSDPLRDEINARGATLLSPHVRTRRKPPRDQHQIGRHYKQRWLIERFFAWLAAWRRLATRWEPRSSSYQQWLCLGISLIYIRD